MTAVRLEKETEMHDSQRENVARTIDYRLNKRAERCPLCGQGAHLRRAKRGENIKLIWAHEEDDLGKDGKFIWESCGIYISLGRAILVQSGETAQHYFPEGQSK